ncbi:unnamed protein product [Vitrella brassicaformis CCMP3155]|uniref:B box-type domain-containing protein n=4 Tax=Vitrella brassicaformis TaxID=1169539 RepID=A0A0G4FN49_VITBC|nr:unnamed protein product [Vitrella brassicaformis CCMP3155]|eukprot:CEM15353.1 unnamed protein product [Vitrella brassicaformis CCMP3155]
MSERRKSPPPPPPGKRHPKPPPPKKTAKARFVAETAGAQLRTLEAAAAPQPAKHAQRPQPPARRVQRPSARESQPVSAAAVQQFYEHILRLAAAGWLGGSSSQTVRVSSVKELCRESDKTAHEELAKRRRGPVAYACVSLGGDGTNEGRADLEGTPSTSELVGCEWAMLPLKCSWMADAMRNGEKLRVLVGRLALGRYLSHTPSQTLPDAVPYGYSSVVRGLPSRPPQAQAGSDEWAAATVRVSDAEQILPVVRVEAEAAPKKEREPDELLCDECEREIATVYCPADRAHLCRSCDVAVHEGPSANPLMRKHRRYPVSESPRQFGRCPQHPSEYLEWVCLKCWVAFCPLCLLFGSHSDVASDPEFKMQHPLISTQEAYRAALKRQSPSEKKLAERRSALLRDLDRRKTELYDVHANLDLLHTRLSRALKHLLDHIQKFKRCKLAFLESMKRQVLAELLMMEWIEDFSRHARLALPPDTFLQCHPRTLTLVDWLFGDRPLLQIDESHQPRWLCTPLTVRGTIKVTSSITKPLAPGERVHAPGQRPASPYPLVPIYGDNMDEEYFRMQRRC